MKYSGVVLAVREMQTARKFYEDTMGLTVISDFGANVAFEGGLALQTLDSFADLLLGMDAKQIRLGGNDAELYFENDGVDGFAETLTAQGMELVHDIKEQPWGQRVVRFYDHDRHIIEVGETMEFVIRRFLKEGMTPEEVADKTMYPLTYIVQLGKELQATETI